MKESKWFKPVVAILSVVIILGGVTLFMGMGSGGPSSVNLSTVVEDVKAGRISQIDVASSGDQIIAYYKDGTKAESNKEPGSTIQDYLQKAGVQASQMPAINVQAASPLLGGLLSSLIFIGPMILIMVVMLILFSRSRPKAQNPTDQAFSFTKSRARVITSDRPAVTFADVAGVDEAKEELQEVVEFLKLPQRFLRLGARIPKGLLLIGPPGTGKTLMAKAVAGEAGVPFFSISGSEFVEVFVGVGASRVRDLFDQAKRNAPCIVFIDEIDAVGRQRGAGLGGSHDEREQTLNQILVEMDGFDTATNIVVIAATNRPDILDPALLRPGRFDRQVVLDRPDIKGRLAILEVHAKGKPLDKEVSLETLAKQTPGFSGADLENLINEGAILAARRNKRSISMSELEEAIDRVIAGPERKSRIISPREKTITSYHEIGHAVVARMLPNVDPVHKVSIIARGMTGGYTRVLPTEDRYLWTQSQFKDTLAWSLGGHVAESVFFGEVSTGAADDIKRATDIAKKMVTEYGMSEAIGPLALGHKDELVFLGREISEQRNYSDDTAKVIDVEIKQLIAEAKETAKQLIETHKEEIIKAAAFLAEHETITGAELDQIMGLPPREAKPSKEVPSAVPHPRAIEEVEPQAAQRLQSG